MFKALKIMKVTILGVNIDDVSIDQAISIVAGWLQEGGKHYIVTPNPEFIVSAYGDPEFKKILNKADLAIPDGAGLKFSGKIKNTTTGVDLMEALCQKASKSGWKIRLIGGKDGVAGRTSEKLKEKYPGLEVVYAENGLEVNSDLLFVAFGMGKQEKFIYENLDKLPTKVAMGVGGAFDYISGNVKRAPIWMRQLGLEWLFRLIIQPWRIKRQVNLFKFIFLIIFNPG